ncbi:unnamed protein product [Rhizoctonia solani]|uniref:Uncharacterized protein n=1 Tax=Rhizoctonia solani TaxID=456999 RepID=A0A8H2W722_9AGAM|nr:unnamed protein product [Rhizoctonia solani]
MLKTHEDVIPVAIIGAGIGGITAAISLQQKLGLNNYQIYEKANDVGGTWRQNTYPGCSSDVPVHVFSLSTDPNPDWDHLFGSYSEIQAYWKHLAIKYGVESHINYSREVFSAIWDEGASNYTLKIKDTQTGAVTQVRAKVVISAIGIFHYPKWPEIPGRESFKGISLHAQAWDHTVEMSGKRIGLIGNGCAGSQILPCISEDESTIVTNFCKTPSWYVGRRQTKIPEWVKWVFRNVPITLKVFRYITACFVEISYQSLRNRPGARYFQNRVQKYAINYIKNTAPAKYHADLLPNYPLGCKRPIADPGYLSALHRPNVHLEWDPIVRIVPEGVVTKSGRKYELDILCFATGFNVESSVVLDVQGRGGLTLKDYYTREGGPTGYLCTTAPDFPNWITLFGPNTIGTVSILYSEELQMNYAIQLIEPVLRGRVQSFSPRPERVEAWNHWLQSYLSKDIYTGCASYYLHNNGEGKNINIWPGGSIYMWWALRRPAWEDFTMEGSKSYPNSQLRNYIYSILLSFALLSVFYAILTGL